MRLPALVLTAAIALAAAPVPENLYQQLQWRNVGPFRGGRVIAVSGVVGDSTTAYFGSVGGGVWKTTDSGASWNPIFDSQHIASIGAIAVAPSNPNIIYVGSGESDMRSQIGFGDGMYKSTDAGKTWTHLGLRDSRQIAKILVDPADANLVYVAVLGHAYGPNPERGVYRSTDGGDTFQKILDRGPSVGAVDLAFDPANSKILYATVWNAHRPQWSQYAPLEGPGSGMFKSTDGGDHWAQLREHGLPAEKDWHRSAVTTSGHRVYVLIDALYRSDDAGGNWTKVSTDPRLTGRGWYFSGMTANPKNPDDVWVPNVALYHSVDGGKTFTVNRGAPGGDDYHTLWIDPSNPRFVVLGSDQGTNVSLNGGATWSSWYNQPTGQFYHVITDNKFPYMIYGAAQDSGTAGVPNRTNHGEIDARDWVTIGGEESGYIALDPKDPNIFYIGDTNGALDRFDRRTGESQNITPWPLADESSARKYRYPWTAPLLFSKSEPGTLYFASQFLFKTIDGGLNWQTISPDLTGKDVPYKVSADDPAMKIQQGNGVIYAVAPSPLKAGLVWVGSDTGLIHITQDGGKTWPNITPKGLEPWSKISQIEASHFDPAVAYASVDRHRMEDYKPYIYRTRDYGKTWDLIVSGLKAPEYINSIKEDPSRKGLLYACTEFGIEVSFDDGDHWQSLQLNLPTVSVRDLDVHGNDLVIATHGRAFWVLDDASPLRQLTAQSASATFLIKPAAAIRLNPEEFSGTPFPVEEPKAKNAPEGAMINFNLKSPGGEVTLEFLDNAGHLIRRVSSSDQPPPMEPQAIADVWFPPPPRVTTNAGMNRYLWDLRYPAPNSDVRGPQVLPGTYTIRLTAGGQHYTQALKVMLDPRSKATAADLAKQLQFSLEVIRTMKTVGSDPKLKPVLAELNAALGVALSADRTPPAAAIQVFEDAKSKLAKP